MGRWLSLFTKGIELNNSLTSNLIVANPCGTVKARYMVTDVEDYSYVASSSTSLNPYDPHTTLNTNNDQLSDSSYSSYEVISEEEYNSEDYHVPNHFSHETITQVTETLGTIDLLTCYNKFLFHYKLPPLHHPQTIHTFLYYLFQEFSSYYSPYYIKISILNKKDKDNNYVEAHIYLPNETCLLPNHFFPPFQDLLRWFRYVLLKSNTQTIYSPFPLNLSICTHNIRGFNKNLKQQVWEHYCLFNNLDIICLTETKLASNSLTLKPLKLHTTLIFNSVQIAQKLVPLL